MQLKHAIPFLGGLNRDDDPRYLPEGDYDTTESVVIDYVLDGGPCSVGIESTILGFDGDEVVVYRLGGCKVEEIESLIGKVTAKVIGNPLLTPPNKCRLGRGFPEAFRKKGSFKIRSQLWSPIIRNVKIVIAF